MLKFNKTDRGVTNDGLVLRLPCEVNYCYVETQEDLEKALELIIPFLNNPNEFVALDLETTGFDPFIENIITCQIGLSNDRQFIIDFRRVDEAPLINLLKESTCQKLGQNLKFDGKFFYIKYGILLSPLFDTYLAEIVINCGEYGRGQYSLDAITKNRLGTELTVEIASLNSSAKKADKHLTESAKKRMQQSFLAIGQEDLSEAQLAYAAQDVAFGVLFEIASSQISDLTAEFPSTAFDKQYAESLSPDNLEKYLSKFPEYLTLWPTAKLEFEFLETVIEIESRGINFNQKRHKNVIESVKSQDGKLRTKFLELLSKKYKQKTLLGTASVNPDSNAQVKEALNSVGVPVEDTSAETLDNSIREYKEGTYNHDVLDTLLKYRKTSKTIAAFAENLATTIHKITKNIHPSINQIVNTGRISVKNPNLQQIPRDLEGQLDEEKLVEKVGIRECFVAKPGYKFLILDYSGQELRVAASLSNSETMLHAFKEGRDLHCVSASLMYNCTYEEIFATSKVPETTTKEGKNRRGAAKLVSFGSLYGSGAYNFAGKLRVSFEEAQDILDRYWQAYPRLSQVMKRYGTLANLYGYSNTVLGRKRHYSFWKNRIAWGLACGTEEKLNKLIEEESNLEWLLEAEMDFEKKKTKYIEKFKRQIARAGGNHLIQGTSADMMKLAAVYIRRRMKKENIDAAVIGLVHDEVIVECKEEDCEKTYKLVEYEMIKALNFFCPNVVGETEGEISPYWKK